MPIRVLVAVVVCLSSTTATAQVLEQKWEIAGGIAYTNTDFRLQSDQFSDSSTGLPLGWNITAAFFATDDVALVGELGTQYGTQNLGGQVVDATLTTYMGGGRFGEHNGPLEFTLHLLAGVAVARADLPPGATVASSDTSPAVAGGGGLSYVLGSLGIRFFQIDVVFANVMKSTPAIRIHTGLFYRW